MGGASGTDSALRRSSTGGIQAEKSWYTDLAMEFQEKGWKATTYPMKIGCCDFVAQSTSRFLKDTGFSSGEVRTALKDIAKEVEKGSFWLWLRRNDKSWGAEKSQGIRT